MPAPDLFAALEAIFAANAGLATAVPGGLHSLRAPDRPTLPYAVATIRDGGVELRTNSNDRNRVPVVIRAHGTTIEQARAASDAIDAVMAGAVPDVATASYRKLVRDGEPRDGKLPGRGSGNALQYYRERQYLTRGRRPSV